MPAHNSNYVVLAECDNLVGRPWCFTDVMSRHWTLIGAQRAARYWAAANFHVAIFVDGVEEGTAVCLYDSDDAPDAPAPPEDPAVADLINQAARIMDRIDYPEDTPDGPPDQVQPGDG